MRLTKVACILLAGWLGADCLASVRTGLDNIGAHKDLFQGRRLGIIANHTSYDSQGKYIVDVFRAMEGVRVVALFSPEHGLRGSEEAGKKVANETDPVSGLPVHSLYGGTNKPTPQMLADVDVLVFDIQDVGARFYTYLYTMSLAMEAAAENGKRFVVLDRPNPINGTQIEGPILEPKFATFVGLYPIPVRYGMTVGELARMINGEGWLAKGAKADLTVVPLTGWRRGMWFDQTGLRFIKPSPNMPDLETAALYPGLCLLEGTNLSEGRGTPKPFRQFGAPWIDADPLAARLNNLGLPGVGFWPASFTPTSSKFQSQECHGVEIRVYDHTRLEPFWTGVQIVNELYRLYPNQFEWREKHFDRLCGTATIREAIIVQKPLQPLKTAWAAECKAFEQTRRKYLLYTGQTAESQMTPLVKLEELVSAVDNLRLNYRVTNVLPYDVWVCANLHDSVEQDSIFSRETLIADGTLQIRRRGNMKQDYLINALHIYAVYHRLPPGASRCDSILLPLPVRGCSPVAKTEPPVCPVVLDRVILELGYFGDDLPALISANPELTRRVPNAYLKPSDREPDTAYISYIIPQEMEETGFGAIGTDQHP